eukprot:gb/GEZJ01006375.1/.p1 GENE.gb/GEZJ01006375.1/~~gb/GEZJ01006375.1/.p1  ORF type:complete len:214 (+),score=16.50 gb/GEZJ01006375.1/:567-1208(+)
MWLLFMTTSTQTYTGRQFFKDTRSKSFHGTIAVAQKSSVHSPIRTSLGHTSLTARFANASDLLTPTSKESISIRNAKALLLGCIGVFSENLLSPDSSKGATLGNVVSTGLEGHATGTATKIDHLQFLDLPSNSFATTEKVLECYLKASVARATEDKAIHVLCISDCLRYLRVWQALYGNVPSGQRNSELDAVVPVPGGMHFFTMGLCDVAKRL